MNTEQEELTFDYEEIVVETNKAVLIKIDDEEIWFPSSQVKIDQQDQTVYIPEWLATEKGLI